jgi:hypothetical protein
VQAGLRHHVTTSPRRTAPGVADGGGLRLDRCLQYRLQPGAGDLRPYRRAACEPEGGAQPEEVRLRTGPGDYIFVPPFVPHREENPDPDNDAVVVIARSTQEAVVVNLPSLYVLRSAQE